MSLLLLSGTYLRSRNNHEEIKKTVAAAILLRCFCVEEKLFESLFCFSIGDKEVCSVLLVNCIELGRDKDGISNWSIADDVPCFCFIFWVCALIGVGVGVFSGLKSDLTTGWAAPVVLFHHVWLLVVWPR